MAQDLALAIRRVKEEFTACGVHIPGHPRGISPLRGDPYHGGGGGGVATRDTEPYIEMFTSIYMYFKMSICIMYMSCVFLIVYIIYLYVFLFSSRCISYILYSNILSYNTFVFASFSCNMLQMLVNIDLSIPCSLHASTTACSPILSHEGHGAR